jgi:hypothetical protein
MHDSKQIIKRFSTYIYLKDCKGIARLASMRYSNPTLKRLMQVLVESNPEAGEEEWARYFIQVLRDPPKNYQILSLGNRTTPIVSTYVIYFKILCNALLFYYLQPTCLQAAVKISKQLQWSYNIHLHYPLEDCFIIASAESVNPLKIFKSFDLNLSYPLNAYALISLKRIIRNRISQDIKSKSIKLSGYGLLRNVTKKELETALTELAIQPKNVELYGLAWQAFKDIFEDICPVTSSNGSPRKNPSTLTLNDEQLNQIAASYNQQLHHLEIQSQPVNGQKIAKKLKTCIQGVQDYQNRTVVSLDAPVDSTSNLLSHQTDDPLEEVIDVEYEQELGHIREIILQAFAALDPLAKKTLMLWLGLGINQTDFLSVLNLQKQYQVTRQFQRYLKTILKAVVDSAYIQAYWRETTTKTAIHQSSREHLAYLKDYLSGYCQNFFAKGLEKIVQEEISRDKKNIVIQYLREINNQSTSRTKAEHSSTNSQSISGEFTKIKDMIQEKFVDSVESQLSIKLSDYSSSDQIISSFIDDWLQENKAILY